MGKTTGFLEHTRVRETYAPVLVRLKHHREFVDALTESEAEVQSARCMDCGTPFCTNGCPVSNIIPDFNDLVYQRDWHRAFTTLDSTNNFPEFTGRVCPAPCEAACTLNINDDAVGIKSIEHAVIDRAWSDGLVVPQPARTKTGKRVAIVGSGPAGLAAAQQLARAGHAVTVFEKNDAIGGLLRYGIPDFKLEKIHIDRRVAQLEAEGVEFRTGVLVGALPDNSKVTNWSRESVSSEQLLASFDAVLLSGGAEQPRDLPAPGRDLEGVHFAMEFLPQQNKVNANGKVTRQLYAEGKHVVVIGGGDTGSDCVGTSNRQGAASVTQFELMPMPPEQEHKPLVWPYWPLKLRVSSSHEEGCERAFAIATTDFIAGEGADASRVKAVRTVEIAWRDGTTTYVEGTERTVRADLVLLAMGFTNPVDTVLQSFGVECDARGNARATTDAARGYATNVPRVFAAGDMRRGQSLVVWAIREGRQAAHAIDRFLMGTTSLPL